MVELISWNLFYGVFGLVSQLINIYIGYSLVKYFDEDGKLAATSLILSDKSVAAYIVAVGSLFGFSIFAILRVLGVLNMFQYEVAGLFYFIGVTLFISLLHGGVSDKFNEK